MVFYIEIKVVNTGDLSLEEIIINWKVPSIFRDIRPAEEEMKQTGILSKDPIARHVSTDKHSTIISYVIQKLDPNVAVNIQEYVNIARCRWPIEFTETTQDQVPVQVKARVDIKIPIEISISATDVAVTHRAFQVQAHPAESSDELSAQISSPNLEDMKKGLKRDFPKTPDSKIEEIAGQLTTRGALPCVATIVVLTKLAERAHYGDWRALVEDTTQSQIGRIIDPFEE